MTEKINDSNPVRVKPVAFRSSSRHRGPSRAFYKWLTGGVLAVLFTLLGAGVWFVFTARQVVIDIDPAPQHVSIGGGLPAFGMASYYLIRPGAYFLEARRPCYQLLKKNFIVSDEKHQKVTFQLQPLPGYITFDIQPADGLAVNIEGLQILVDGQKSDPSPAGETLLLPGKRQVEIRSENYMPLTADVEVEGCDRRQTFSFDLKPDWAQVSIDSLPSAAAVWIDSRHAGQTPLTTSIKSGPHSLEIRAPGYQTWHTKLDVIAGQPIKMAAVRLLPATAKLQLSSDPSGANVLVGNRYFGATPLVLSLEPDQEHTILLNRAGYQKAVRRLKLSPGEEKKLRVKLTAQEGVVELAVTPANSELVIDGKSRGPVDSTIRLAAGPHRLEIRKKDYLPFQTTITVRPGYPRKIQVVLQKRSEAKPVGNTGLVAAANGYKLKPISDRLFHHGLITP